MDEKISAPISAPVEVAEGAEDAPRATPIWRRLPRRALPIALALLYLALWGVCGAIYITGGDLNAFFLPSARIALAGRPLFIYEVRLYAVYPNANGPLSVAPLTVVIWVAQRIGWLNDPRRLSIIITTAFAIFPLLVAREGVHAADRLLGARLRGWRRLLAYMLIAFQPEFWHSLQGFGHVEHALMLWLTLLAVAALVNGRPTLAGVCLGLALLTRTAAVLYLAPLALIQLRQRRWGAFLRLSGAATLTSALGLLPFWLADRADLLYSLFGFRVHLPVSGGGVWGLLLNTPAQAFALRYDSYVVVAAALLLTTITLALRRDLDARSPDVYALLALANLCFPLLMKTLWPYYYLDAAIFFAIWRLVHAPTWTRSRSAWLIWGVTAVTLPLLVTLCAQLAESGLAAVDGSGTWLPGWSLTLTLCTLALQLLPALWLWLDADARIKRHALGSSLPATAADPHAATARV